MNNLKRLNFISAISFCGIFLSSIDASIATTFKCPKEIDLKAHCTYDHVAGDYDCKFEDGWQGYMDPGSSDTGKAVFKKTEWIERNYTFSPACKYELGGKESYLINNNMPQCWSDASETEWKCR